MLTKPNDWPRGCGDFRSDHDWTAGDRLILNGFPVCVTGLAESALPDTDFLLFVAQEEPGMLAPPGLPQVQT
jgi:hypothetical protein